jgi:hypothetical protein
VVTVRSLVRRLTRQDELRIAARCGYLISGTLHLLIAYLIVRIVTGGRGDADPSGALATVATSMGGVGVLWVIAAALVPLALWRLAESLIGLHPAEGFRGARADESVANRLKAFGLLLVYCGVAFTAVRFALGSRQSSREQNVGLSAHLMQTAWGKTILIAGGAVIVIIGAYNFYKGASRKFEGDLTSPPNRLITTLGVCGYTAEGLVLALAGILVILASIDSKPEMAAGLDAAVKTLAVTPWGRVLLLFAAAGFGAYGAYSFALSRHARM